MSTVQPTTLEQVLELLRPKEGRRIDLGLGEGYEAYLVSERYNPLIKRKELEIVVVHVGKPTLERRGLRGQIAQAFGVDVKNVYVRKIETEYGVGRTRVEVHIYDSLERALQFEPAHIICRNMLPEEFEQEPFKTIYETKCLRKK
ncbi:MAG TPA: 30S ribosomal protein S24e [Pyrodictium sp.]|nr:30S ribosomal protein S24e [Pyrodictium sp.]